MILYIIYRETERDVSGLPEPQPTPTHCTVPIGTPLRAVGQAPVDVDILGPPVPCITGATALGVYIYIYMRK